MKEILNSYFCFKLFKAFKKLKRKIQMRKKSQLKIKIYLFTIYVFVYMCGEWGALEGQRSTLGVKTALNLFF